MGYHGAVSCAAEHPVAYPAPEPVDFALPARLPDDPAALKALLLAQQEAFAAQLAQQWAEQTQAFEAQRAAERQAFDAHLLELYEQIRLSRQRLFGRREPKRMPRRGGCSTRPRHWPTARRQPMIRSRWRYRAAHRRTSHRRPRVLGASAERCRASCRVLKSSTRCPKPSARVPAAHRWW